MSFFEDASLVLIPSAQKTSKVYSVKPTDGTGDLTFTRSNDTATRVASNGLIEKVRTNLILQSNTFSNASWSNIGSSETSGQAGYDGTNNAWSLVEDSSTGLHTLVQVPSTFGSTTLSIYAKAGTRNWVFLRGVQSSSNVRAWFNLSTGTIGTVEANGTAKIESVGNGWYRCSLAVSNFQSGFEAYVGISSADNTPTYAGNGTGNILIQNFQYETGDIATPYIATTSAAVSVGPVANVPRLDYLGSTCPKLILEPQRVNKWYFSESFDNAEWLKSNVTISANSAVSPDGYTNADKMVDTTANDEHRIRATTALFTITTATTFSIFAKAAEYSRFAIANLSASEYVKFNLSTGAVISTGANFSNAKIENYGNGWYRLSATTSTSGTHGYGLLNDAGDFVFTGTGTKGVFIYGAQAEEAAYATSYIPTLGAAVTRGEESAVKSSISSLIGQQEGVVYWEGVVSQPSEQGASFSSTLFNTARNSNTNTAIEISHISNTNRLQAKFFIGNGTFTPIINLGSFSIPAGTYVKMAFAYKSGQSALYINGVSVNTSSATFTSTTTMSEINLADRVVYYGYSGNPTVNKLLIFPTRLSNSDLAALTA